MASGDVPSDIKWLIAKYSPPITATITSKILNTLFIKTIQKGYL